MSLAEYQEAIDLIRADLGLQDDPTPLRWRFHRGRTLPKMKQVGQLVVTRTSGGALVSARIEVATMHGRPQVLNTIAHELRHLWQRTSGIYQYRDIGYYWSGTQFVPRPVHWKRGTYGSEPQEIDAREYARTAVYRLFGHDTRVEEVADEVVAALFRKSLI